MSRAIHYSLRTATAVIFSTAIGFLFVALFWQLFRGLPATLAVFASVGALSLLVTTIYGSVTAGAELNWNAVSSGGFTVGQIAAQTPTSVSTTATLTGFRGTLAIRLR